MLSSLLPSEKTFTGVCEFEDTGTKILGQIRQSHKLSTAYLNYLLQPPESDPADLVFLLEGLLRRAGHWGSKQMVAEIPLDSIFFAPFRKAGFSVLAKQQIYRWDDSTNNLQTPLQGTWRIWNCEDVLAMRSLYLAIVPPLIQPIEPLTRREMLGLVYVDAQGSIQAYADIVQGPAGAWVLPLIHPQVQEDVADMLRAMVNSLPERNRRSVYIASRSYQPWIDQAMQNLPVSSGPEQAIMVRYLALRQKAEENYAFSNIENGSTEPTLPITPIKNHQT